MSNCPNPLTLSVLAHVYPIPLAENASWQIGDILRVPFSGSEGRE